MNGLEKALRGIASELDSRSITWCLVGGLAVGTRAEPRTTRDVYVAVSVADDSKAEALIADLSSAGYRIHMVLEQDALQRLATARLFAPSHGVPVIVDLLFASTGIESEICQDAEALEVVEGLTIPVARSGHLIAMKLLAREDRTRPQDLDDLRALLKHCSSDEIERGRNAVRHIEELGAARGRDLVSSLEQLVAELTH